MSKTLATKNAAQTKNVLTELFGPHIEHKVKMHQAGLVANELSAVLIASGEQIYQFRDDIPLNYATNAYFRECLPLLLNPDSFLLIDQQSDQSTLFLKVVADYWHSAPEALAANIAAATNVIEYSDAADLKSKLHLSSGAAFIGSASACPEHLTSVSINPEGLLAHIDYHRAWKTEYEMECMREANRLAFIGHQAAKQSFFDGQSEYQIHMSYLNAINCLDGELPYPNIVAINEHCAVLHHNQLDRRANNNGRSLLIDAGAPYQGYASDITRTYCRPDSDDTYVALLDGVENLEKSLVSSVHVGMDYVDLHLLAHDKVAQLLVQLNIIKVSAEEAVSSGLTAVFFPHGIGHFIGCQVHDKGGFLRSSLGDTRPAPESHPFLRCTRTLEARMSITIEPGIYFIAMLLDAWPGKAMINWDIVKRLAPYGGVRIEDDIAVHATSVENMTRDAFSA